MTAEAVLMSCLGGVRSYGGEGVGGMGSSALRGGVSGGWVG